MKKYFNLLVFLVFLFQNQLQAQNKQILERVEKTMMAASKYMVEEVSTNGGYVWFYLPDLSRRWGEMEAYNTMIWTQNPGTVSVAHMFLNAYHATGDEYYYKAAEKAAEALIWGQSNNGGWNYMIDFAGDRSLKNWYNTIGKNGWRLEEFQHYYGNDTFDDDVTSDAARFLLRIYLEKLDPKYKPALDKAIDFVIKSQYPLGGWPQRYPLKYDFNKAGHPDYSSIYTFNDDVTWENVNFLIQCYVTLGEQRFLDPIMRGMEFFLITQCPNGGWAQQYDLQLNPAGARTYEPVALLPGATFGNAMILIHFYELTGNPKYIQGIPQAISWLEKCRLPDYMAENGRYTHPTFVEVGTDKPVFVHRKGSNVKYGYYYTDYDDRNLLAHYGGKGKVDIDQLKNEYQRVVALSYDDLTKNSPLKVGAFEGEGTPQNFYSLDRYSMVEVPTPQQVDEIIASLDEKGRWLFKHAFISNPYIGDGKKTELTEEYASTNVGDETDTSCFMDPSDQEYISTPGFVMYMGLLINYLNESK